MYPVSFSPATDPYDFFEFVVDSEISTRLTHAELSKRLNPLTVKKGTECVGKNEPLFKVVLVEIRENHEYALVVSLSHVLGDGHTFYNLYGMLDCRTPATALVAERKQCFMDRLLVSSGKKLQAWLASPYLVTGILSNIALRPTPQSAVYTLNSEEVARAKQQYRQSDGEAGQYGDVPFVSTNDVVTSWFFKVCRSSYGMITVNNRNRYDGYTDKHAGNYQSVLLYNKDDFSVPNYIRQSVATMLSKSGAVPNLLETLWYNMSMITNWSSFYCDVSLGDKSHSTMHLPLMNPAECIFRDTCILFNVNKDTQALLFATRNVNFDALMSADSCDRRGKESLLFLGEKLM